MKATLLNMLAWCKLGHVLCAFQGKGTPALDGKAVQVTSPEGHRFVVYNEDTPGPNPVTEVALHVEDLSRSLGKCLLACATAGHAVCDNCIITACRHHAVQHTGRASSSS